jgi:oxygen-independent coproporphyrinogen-3 oxidase
MNVGSGLIIVAGVTTSAGVYVHVPFCTAKCHYCDFNSYAGLDGLVPTYVEAICREIGAQPPVRARSINFGGGTPSLLSAASLARVLGAIRERFDVPDGVELSLEANPGTVAEARLAEVRALGFNRISFGVQSFDPGILAELGRIHGPEEAARARRAARAAGFENVNLDFIYGLPRQTMPSWQETLARAVDLRPEHLSLYSLTVEPGTLFHRRAEQGRLPLPDEDLVADMYELASETLEGAGYVQYEVSNWALSPELRCQHNLGYWRNLPYVGVGPGAHSWFGGRRYVGTLSPRAWASQVLAGEPAVFDVEEIDADLELGETMMLGLRLTDGVDLAELSARFGLDVAARFVDPIGECAALGLIELVGRRLRLTRRARLLGNEVFRRFLESATRRGK